MNQLRVICCVSPGGRTTWLTFDHVVNGEIVNSSTSYKPTQSTLKRTAKLMYYKIGQPGFRLEPAINGIGWYAYIDKE